MDRHWRCLGTGLILRPPPSQPRAQPQLERKLNIAYVNKERAAQHQEAILLKSLEQAREMAIDDQMEYERQLYIKKEMDKEDGRREKMMEQKSVLQKQILDRQVLAVEAREEAERDKEMVEAIVAKINEQDRLEIEERNHKKEEVRGWGDSGQGATEPFSRHMQHSNSHQVTQL